MCSNSFGDHGMTATTALLEVIPHVLDIISPTIRQVAGLHLLSGREKEDVSQLVDTLISQKLTYVKDDENHERIASSAVYHSGAPFLFNVTDH
jgi:hypothetical protein